MMTRPSSKGRRYHAFLTVDSPAEGELLTGQKLSKKIFPEEQGARPLRMNCWILCGD